MLIDGNVWNDVNSDGLMDEEEDRIEGAVVRLVRYWYDETGIGYWEKVPGQTPGGDGTSGASTSSPSLYWRPPLKLVFSTQ